MSKAPRTLIKSRETLHAIRNNPNELRKYELFDRILDMVWYDISKKINKLFIYLQSKAYCRLRQILHD